MQRQTRQRRPVGRVAPSRANRLSELRVENIAQRPPDRVAPRDAVQLLQRRVPPDDPVVEVDHEQAVVERLENVLVERAHPVELKRLDVQLPVEASVLKRRGDLARDRDEQRGVFAVQRLARVLPSKRQHGDGAILRHARE